MNYKRDLLKKTRKKRTYIKPRIKYRTIKRHFVVAVSCQKIFGESDYCQTEIEV